MNVSGGRRKSKAKEKSGEVFSSEKKKKSRVSGMVWSLQTGNTSVCVDPGVSLVAPVSKVQMLLK